MSKQETKYQRTFFLDDIIGDSTGELFKGPFVVKTKLSYEDLLRLDRLRRDFLGGTHQENASVMAMNIANALADLAVRIVESPSWWPEYGNGFNLKDDNVLQTIYDLTLKAQKEEEAELDKKKKESVARLRALTNPETASTPTSSSQTP